MVGGGNGSSATVVRAGSLASNHGYYWVSGTWDEPNDDVDAIANTSPGNEGQADGQGDIWGLDVSCLSGNPTAPWELDPASDCVDAGMTTLSDDIVGTSRPQGAADDIGCYELVP
jgi:hypothetical protein